MLFKIKENTFLSDKILFLLSFTEFDSCIVGEKLKLGWFILVLKLSCKEKILNDFKC
jgi:hypothetical protein